jgi:glycosyltransferase involved in cell wall biosynthesis
MLESNRFFLTVSSLNFRKNFITVLKAFSIFCQNNSHGNLLIIGDLQCDSFQSVNIAEYQNNGRIKFLGRVSDEELISYYRNAVAFVFPSLYEGFGLPPIEAQSCGCPVISSNSSSLPEVLEDSALICDPLDVNQFAEFMNLIYHDNELRTKLIEKGYENAKRFSWDDSAKRIYELVKNIQ